jgi:hypothetical protein
MAYTLKSTGIATSLVMCVAVDEDGTTVKEFVSSSVNTDMTVHADVVKSTSSWKGVTRGYFETLANGSTNFRGITFGTNKPAYDAGSGNPTSVFFAVAGMQDGGSGTAAGDAMVARSTGSPIASRNSSDKLNEGMSTTAGSTSLPTDNSTKFSAGVVHNFGGTNRFFYGLESGSLATDGTASDPSSGGNTRLVGGIGGIASFGNQPAKYHIVAMFQAELSTAEFQSLHDDWFGTLFDSGGTGTAALTGSASSGVQTAPSPSHSIPL